MAIWRSSVKIVKGAGLKWICEPMTHDIRRWITLCETKGNDIQRIHLAMRPLDGLKSTRYSQEDGRKPHGFWWAIGNAWMDYAPTSKTRGAKARSRGIPYLVDTGSASLIRLTDWDSILTFTVRYGCTYAPNGEFFWQHGDQTHYVSGAPMPQRKPPATMGWYIAIGRKIVGVSPG